MMALANWWPSSAAINDCIKPEAESAEECLLLAVHQAMDLTKKATLERAEEAATEQDLLSYFLTDDLPTGTLILPLSGPSGYGKSHLIRWLHAQLRRRPESQHAHIIRVPKSASLRTVVKQIVDALDPEQSPEIYKAFNQAIPDFQPRAAANRLRAELQNVLEERFRQLRLQYSPDSADSQKQLTDLHHLKNLPGLLGDAAFTDRLLGQEGEASDVAPLIRLVRRATGAKTADSSVDDSVPQFEPGDLDMPIGLVNQASAKVKGYYLTTIDGANAEGRARAVKILNEAVDTAVGNSFNLSAKGGYSLQDVILDIRKQLFKDGKELILLVEDFAALTGIQEVLFNICIQEAIRDGKQELCFMRTAIAVTDGYLDKWETIRTRAKYEWAIRPTDERDGLVVSRAVDLVGNYLNASRHGIDQLRRMFSTVDDESVDSGDWLTAFGDEDDQTSIISGFGYSSRNYALFPFNREAVAAFCDRYLKVGGRLSFNPRAVINYILRPLLLDHRASFDDGSFPETIAVATPSAAIAEFVSKQRLLNSQQRAQYRSLLANWGGNPEDDEGLHVLNPSVLTAFKLPPLEAVLREPGDSVQEEGDKDVTGGDQDRDIDAPQEDPKVVEWKKRLQAWREGVELDMPSARAIRNACVKLVDAMSNWTLSSLSGSDVKNLSPKAFQIPSARGNQEHPIVVKIADTSEDPDGFLFKSLLAIVRWDLKGNQWNYPEADEDSVYAFQLGQRLVSEYLSQSRAIADSALTTVLPALTMQAHALGLTTVKKDSTGTENVETLLAQILTPAVEAPIALLGTGWALLRRDCFTYRKGLMEQFFRRAMYFQGDTGKTPLALDVTRIWKLMREQDVYAIGVHAKDLDREKGLDKELVSHIKQLGSSLRPLSGQFYAELCKWGAEMTELLGEDTNKVELYAELRAVYSDAIRIGVWPENVDQSSIREILKQFNACPLAEIRSLYVDAERAQTEAARMAVLGRVNPKELQDTATVMSTISRFVSSMNGLVETRRKALMGLDKKPVIEELLQELDVIATDMAVLHAVDAETAPQGVHS
jgi:hypothetical protein